MPDPTAQRYTAPAAAAAAETLLALARSDRPLTAAEIASRTGRTKSLIYRVLAELDERRFVVRDGARTYTLGVAAVELGGAFSTSVSMLASIRGVLRELAGVGRESANLGILERDEVLYLAREEGDLSVVSVSRVGKRLPANSTSIGKALLAELADDEVRAVLAGRGSAHELRQLTPRSIGTVDDLLVDLDQVRSRGYAEEIGETVMGRACASVAIPFGERGVSTAAIGVSMADHRYQAMRDDIIEALTEAKARLVGESQLRAAMGEPS